MKTGIENWCGLILFLAPIFLLHYFPNSLLIKLVLIIAAIIIAIRANLLNLKENTTVVKNENIFYLKNRTIEMPKIGIILGLVFSYASLNQHPLSFIFVIGAILLIVSILFELVYVSEYPQQYILLEGDEIKRRRSAEVDLKKVKYVAVAKAYIILYEKWQEHKITFEKFEEGEQLRAMLIAKVKKLEIEIKPIASPLNE